LPRKPSVTTRSLYSTFPPAHHQRVTQLGRLCAHNQQRKRVLLCRDRLLRYCFRCLLPSYFCSVLLTAVPPLLLASHCCPSVLRLLRCCLYFVIAYCLCFFLQSFGSYGPTFVSCCCTALTSALTWSLSISSPSLLLKLPTHTREAFRNSRYRLTDLLRTKSLPTVLFRLYPHAETQTQLTTRLMKNRGQTRTVSPFGSNHCCSLADPLFRIGAPSPMTLDAATASPLLLLCPLPSVLNFSPTGCIHFKIAPF
jgi:hypothetical protein